MAAAREPRPSHPLFHHAPWLLAVGGLVLALVFASADKRQSGPVQPAMVQLTASADGLGIDVPHVLVAGKATIDVVPDVVDVTVVLSVERQSASKAVADLREQQDELSSALAAEGVTGSKLRVSQLSVSPVYEHYPDDRKPRIRAYAASLTVVATTREFDRIGDLLERAAGFDLGYVSTQFRSTELQAKKRELRDMALEAARDKARQSAAALDVELGSVISIEEIGRSDRANWGMEGNVFANEYRSAPAAEGDALIPGAVPLSLTVEVEYAIAGGGG